MLLFRNQRPEAAAFCLKVMVVSIILYDHIDPHGAFSKQSPINVTILTLRHPKRSHAS